MATKFYTHPEYMRLQPDWNQFRDLFEGKHAVLTQPQYLWMHEFEGNKAEGGTQLRGIREQRTQYVNFYRSFIERFVSMIFKDGIDTEQVDELFGDLIDDVDGRGTSFTSFVKSGIAVPYFNYGKPTVLTDSFGVQSGTRKEEMQIGQRPFWDSIDPLDIPDWETESMPGDRFGDLNALRCIYHLVEPRTSLTQEPVTREYTKLLLMNDGGKYAVQTYVRPDDFTGAGNEVVDRAFGQKGSSSDWILVGEEVETDLEEIPIATITRTSWMEQVIPQALQLHNLQSVWDNILLFQAHQRGFIAGTFQMEDGKPAIQTEYAFHLLPENATVTIVDPANTSSIEKRYEVVLGNMFRTVFNQNRVMNTESKGIASFQTIREMKEEFLTAARNAAQDIENVANEAIQHWALFKGIKDFQGKIQLGNDLELKDIEHEIEVMQLAADRIRRHPKWNKEVDKKLAQSMNLNNIDEILEEIEAAPAEAQQARPNRLLERLNAVQQETDTSANAQASSET